jgi:glycosyltransferase involved in cell wall biosynthesis
MEESKILLSIIIPTKNRYSTLLPVISALLKYITSEYVEFLIQDNSDKNDDYYAFCSKINDKRISYFYSSKMLSIKQNTRHAIDNSTGKYIMFIGDDDLVAPNVIDFVKEMESKNIDSLIYNAGKYWWDSVVFKKPNYYENAKILTLPKDINSCFVKLDTEAEFDYLLQHGCVSIYRTPRFYHGIISRKVLEKIKDKTSISPDISFSTGLSLVCKEHFYVNYPLSIYGASKNSGGGMTMEKKHYGSIEDMPWLPKNTLSMWDDKIPKIWSEHTAYPVSVSNVLEQFNSKKVINYNVFYSSMLVYEFYLLEYLKPKILSHNRFTLDYLYFSFQVFKRIVSLLVNKFKFKFRLLNLSVYNDFNIDDCMVLLSEIKVDNEFK